VIFLSFQMSKLMHCFLHWNYFVKTFGKINLWILVVCYFSFSLSSKVPALSMTVIGRHGVETTPILFSSIHNLSGSDDPFCLLFLCYCKLLSSTI